jgi:hypothetical protein
VSAVRRSCHLPVPALARGASSGVRRPGSGRDRWEARPGFSCDDTHVAHGYCMDSGSSKMPPGVGVATLLVYCFRFLVVEA